MHCGRWGGEGGKLKTIKLGSSEFIKEVSGTIGAWAEYNNIISTITFVTNVTTHGPFGDPRYGIAPFSIPVPNNSSIVGFFGRGKVYLDAIGVYVLEDTAAAS
nr:unnamed protein product [Digitaria exilis]